MEVKQDEMTQEQYDEMKKIARDFVCSECGADLQLHTVPERATLRVGCFNPDHHGYVERLTYTQAFRRGEPVHPAIQEAIEKKSIERTGLERAMNLLALRYPDAIRDPPTAALFIYDCARLGLEPLISPAEAIPVVFTSRKKRRDADGKIMRDREGKPLVEEKETVQMVITGDGWLSMAARGCKDDWVGPPRVIRLEDYLLTLPEHKDRPYDQIKQIASDIKLSECKDKDAWYYLAIGKRRGMEEDAIVPGYFTNKDMEKADKAHLPAASEPGNQATWRAQKKWVRKVYPECRQKMIELTREWLQRAEGIKEAQEYIDAEYRLIAEVGEKTAPGEGGGEKTGAGVSTSEVKTEKPSGAPPAPEHVEEKIEGEGFHIDLTWLKETLKALKWSDETTRSFLANKFHIDTKGTVAEVLARLNRDQAEEFVKEIENRVTQKQMDLWE